MGEKKIEVSKDWFKAKTRKEVKATRKLAPIDPEKLPRFLSNAEAARILDCHPRSVKQVHHRRGLRMHRIGGTDSHPRYKTTREWIADYMNQENNG